jgi:hypothetical protein
VGKTKGFIKPLALGWQEGWVGGGLGGWCLRYGWIDGRREKVRGEYGFSSLVKQNKKGKICFVIYIAGFIFLKNLCYEVIVKQNFKERFASGTALIKWLKDGEEDINVAREVVQVVWPRVCQGRSPTHSAWATSCETKIELAAEVESCTRVHYGASAISSNSDTFALDVSTACALSAMT